MPEPDHKYLKSRQEYIDRYDRATVERCRWAEKVITEDDIRKQSKKKIADTELDRLTTVFNNLHVWFVMGERYAKKEEAIDKWMQNDANKDRFYETTQAPNNITCLTCDRDMFVSYKYLETRLDAPDRMLFTYDCTLGHLPRRGFYNTGEEWKYKNPLCPKCQIPLNFKDQNIKKKLSWIETCPKCGFIKTNEINRAIEKEVADPNFEKDRARFCSSKEGMEYVQWMNTAKDLTEILNKEKEKEKEKDFYDAAAKIQKLTIMELENLLRPVVEKLNYVKFELGKPDIGKDVTIEFTTQDATSGRNEYDSIHNLQKVIKKRLEPTNWRLMSDGINYRLGFLSGRLRAYEKEEDLFKLVEIEVKKITN